MSYDPDQPDGGYDPGPFDAIEGRCNHPKYDGSGLCRNEAGKGTDHLGFGTCKKHGGTSPNHRKHAEKLAHDALVADVLDRYASEDETDPLVQLMHALRTAARMRALYAALVGTLTIGGTPAYVERPEGRGGRELEPNYVPVEPAGIYGPDHKGDAKPHIYELGLRHWTSELAKVCKDALTVGIEERRMRLEEARAEEAARLVRGVAVAVIEAFAARGADGGLVSSVRGELGPLLRRVIESSELLEGHVVEAGPGSDGEG